MTQRRVPYRSGGGVVVGGEPTYVASDLSYDEGGMMRRKKGEDEKKLHV